MSVQNSTIDLTNRRSQIEMGGGEAAIKQVHAEGKLTARERIESLLDTSSFVEIGAFVKPRATDFNLSTKEAPADGVVTGYGAINGRLVYVYSQDATVMGGSLGEMHAKKITSLYDLALKMGAPIIGLIDSAGLRLQEATDALDGFGSIFLKQSMASGVIPQITAVLGNCGGGASIIPSLSDFTFMTSNKTKLFVNSPNALDDASATFEKYASADFHSKETGLVDFVCQDDRECMNAIRLLVDLLPSNNMQISPESETTDDINREVPEIVQSISSNTDAKTLIAVLADSNQVLEVKSDYAKEVVTAFIRMNGATIGAIGNMTVGNDGKLTFAACEKITKFVKICDAFNIPILTLTDVAGFSASAEQEKQGLSKAIARMVNAFATALVPKVNVIVGNAIGTAYVVQNSKHVGADVVYALPNAKISVMDATSAVKIIYSEEIAASNVSDNIISEKVSEFENNQSSPYAAASRGYIDDVIQPAGTRKRIIAAFEMLYSKSEVGPDKKHCTI